MRQNILETFMGGIVLILAAALLIFAYTSSKSSTVKGYPITAKFDRIDGLVAGTDVKMSGIKIGSISKVVLDPQTYLAVVTMTINPSVKLPEDTVAEVSSEGLLGGKFMALVPGGADKMLAPNGEIQYTQSSVNLESLIGKLMFGKDSDKDKKKDKEEAQDTKDSISEDSSPHP